MYGWFWNKNEFQSQPNATGPTLVQSKPTGTPLSDRLNSGDWVKGWPFYKGSNNWTDYLSSGALVQSLTGKINLNNKGNFRAWLLWKKPPDGTLLVDNKSRSMINAQLPYVPYVSGGMKPNTTTLPAGYYKKGSTFKVVVFDPYVKPNGELTEYTFELMTSQKALEKAQPGTAIIAGIDDFLRDVNAWFNKSPVNPNTVSPDIKNRTGQWVKVSEQTLPFEPIGSTINLETSASLLPWEVGGVKGIRGITGSSLSKPITGGNQVPFKPSQTKEDTLFTTQNIALIGVGAVAFYVFATRKK